MKPSFNDQVGFFGTLTIILAVSKLVDGSKISWVLVFAPTIIGMMLQLFWATYYILKRSDDGEAYEGVPVPPRPHPADPALVGLPSRSPPPPGGIWHEHHGGPCPVSSHTKVWIRTRSNAESKRPSTAESFWWGRDEFTPNIEIVAYMVQETNEEG